MIGLLYQAVYRFFNGMTTPLNKNEVDQPAPLEVQREHLVQQLAEVEREIVKRKQMLDSYK